MSFTLPPKGKDRQQTNPSQDLYLGEGSQELTSWAKPPARTTQRSKSAGLVPPLDFTRPKRKPSAADKARVEASAQSTQRHKAYQAHRDEIVQSSQASTSRIETQLDPFRFESPLTPTSPVSRPQTPEPVVQNVQTTVSMSTSTTTTMKIPFPWDTKSSPSFDGKSAESLLKYIMFCKMIIEEAKVTTTEAKKEILLRYCNIHIQEEWSSLDEYDTGTFEEWVEAIESLYPEIKSFRTGSLKRLDEICTKNAGLKKSDQGLIKRLNVQFKLEADKLTKPPSLVTNIVLVEKYLTCFEPIFAIEINSMISRVLYDREAGLIPKPITVQTPAQAQAQAARVERPEETIELDELFVLVERLSRINIRPSGSATSHLASTPAPIIGAPAQYSDWARTEVKIKEEVNERMEAGMALIKDTLVVSEGRIKQEMNSVSSQVNDLKTDMRDMKKSVEQALNQNSYRGRDPPPHRDIVQAGQASNRDGEDRTFRQYNKDCFYCYLSGHMVRDCPYKREHIDTGKIIIENGRMKLGDGAIFPKWPESKSQKQRVDDYFGNKSVPGAPHVLIQDYNPPQPGQVAQFKQDIIDNLNTVYDTRDDEIRCLKVQNVIKENCEKQSSYHPVATFHQGHYQPPSQQPTYGGGSVQTYNPSPMNYQTSQPINFPASPPAAPVAQAPTAPGGFDFAQFAQMAQMVDAVRGNGGMPTTQQQFKQGQGRPASPN